METNRVIEEEEDAEEDSFACELDENDTTESVAL